MAKVNLDRILPFASPILRSALRAKQAAREAHFEATGIAPGRVVFLGDSITEWTAWEDWFPELPTTNRGIGGQAIRDVLARLHTAVAEPKAISLLIGTNDLHGLGKSSDVDNIADQMDELTSRIRVIAPSAPLFINSVLPRSTHFRDRIMRLNERYCETARANGATYVNVWPALAGEDGAIRPELTADGLHLSIAGYRAWSDVLRPLLAPFVQL